MFAGETDVGAMMAPPSVPEMSRNALDTLEQLSAVAIRQDLQWLEEIVQCCEARNKYKISTIPIGQENRTFTDAELLQLPMAFDVRENSTLCCRMCCYNGRAFKLGLFPPGIAQNPRWPETEPLMTLERPFRCTCWCGRLFCPQELSISAEGRRLGRIEQECRCIDCCCACTLWMKSVDANEQAIHSFKTPLCGKNCFAPSCCNRVFEIDIFNSIDESERVGVFKNIWPGWNWRGICSPSASNFVVIFPTHASKEDKAILIGSLFLHDFYLFEKTSEDNN